MSPPPLDAALTAYIVYLSIQLMRTHRGTYH